jgi:hypothetical protein
MKQAGSDHFMIEAFQKKILGFPEKIIYRLGVILFYVLLFFAVSLLTGRSTEQPQTTGQVKDTKPE